MVITIKSGIVLLLLEMLLLGNCTDWISKLSTRKPKLVSTQCRFECDGIQVYTFFTFYQSTGSTMFCFSTKSIHDGKLQFITVTHLVSLIFRHRRFPVDWG